MHLLRKEEEKAF